MTPKTIRNDEIQTMREVSVIIANGLVGKELESSAHTGEINLICVGAIGTKLIEDLD